MEYVYKYVMDDSQVVYVGITKNLDVRIKEHCRDKLRYLNNPDIYYFPVKYRGDAELLETYLINYYGTAKYYNVAKTSKGDFSFLDIIDLIEWTKYDGVVDNSIKPFVVTNVIGIPRECVVEKEIFINSNSVSGRLKQWDALCKRVNAEINVEEQIVSGLTELLKQDNDEYDKNFVVIGLELHNRRLTILNEFSILNCGKEFVSKLTSVNLELMNHEGGSYY